MASSFPNGTVFAVSTAFSAAVLITAVTNDNPAVASAANPPDDGTIVLLQSGWPSLNDRVSVAANSDVDSFELVGIDTSNAAIYEPGMGAGFAVPATGWTNLSQVRDTAKAGGEQQFFTWQYLEDRSGLQRQRPTVRNAKSITVTLDYDPALAWYSALDELSGENELVILRATLPNGTRLFYPVYVGFDADPSLTMNENMTNTATFSMAGDFTRVEAT
jgi:hypothetical protein